jgi:hypothetical protein
MLVSNADTKRGEPGVNLGSTCTTLPCKVDGREHADVAWRKTLPSELVLEPQDENDLLVHL